jgi:hypothetical protein
MGVVYEAEWDASRVGVTLDRTYDPGRLRLDARLRS